MKTGSETTLSCGMWNIKTNKQTFVTCLQPYRSRSLIRSLQSWILSHHGNLQRTIWFKWGFLSSFCLIIFKIHSIFDILFKVENGAIAARGPGVAGSDNSVVSALDLFFLFILTNVWNLVIVRIFFVFFAFLVHVLHFLRACIKVLINNNGEFFLRAVGLLLLPRY